MKRALASLAAGAIGAGVWLAAPVSKAEEPFSYNPPGVLVAGSGEGRADENVYAPGMRFPLEKGPAYLNSQVWGYGGSQGPGGGQCDPPNREYPWWDNYCETRTWDMPLCPAGTGHQGQDLRAGDCEKDTHWVVAGADGEITSIGSYTVYLTTEDGTRYDYLHMGSVQVTVGQKVARGARLGKVSNEFGGTPTTIHLHFNLRQNVAGVGIVFVPPYMSLVTSYQDLFDAPAEGELASATCERVRGASRDVDTPDVPNDVRVAIGGAWDEPGVFSFDVGADRPSEALCGEAGAPCAHGFDAFLPVSLLDGNARDLHVYALSTIEGVAPVELTGSSASVACELFSLKGRGLRAVEGDGVFEKWGFSLLFDQLLVSPAQVGKLPEGDALPADPLLVASEDGTELWVQDGDELRAISADAAFAFRLDVASAEVWSDAERAAAKVGEPWPARPVLVRGEGEELFLLDVGVESPGPGPGDEDDEEDPTAEAKAASCACRTTSGTSSPVGAGLAAAAAVLGLARIRSRRARRRTRGGSVL